MDNVFFSIFPNDLFIDLALYQYGWEACSPLHSFGPATRNHYLFHYIISGKGTLIATDKNGKTTTYHLSARSGFLITPNTINMYSADELDPWEYTWLEFDGLKVKEFLETIGLSDQKPIFHAKTSALGDSVRDEMFYICEHSTASSFHLIGHLYLFLDALQKSSSSPAIIQGERLRDFYTRESIVFIEQHYAEDISVQDIADWCKLNRTYFGKIFKEITGLSPQEFLIQYRMSRATEQLKLTNNSIHSISISVGYPNQLHFSRAFKKTYGISPREWRSANKLHKLSSN
ncbi:MAG: AraC family transcriptional regulator [Cellulosilyticaceae bacterium]